MPWLGGVVRRWFALATGTLSLIGLASFIVTERHQWAWITIGALMLLVLSLAWELHRAERVADAASSQIAQMLDKAIADGRTIAGMAPDMRQWTEHEAWYTRVAEQLRDRIGLAAAHGLGQADDSAKTIGARSEACLAYLEELRALQ